MNQTSKFGFSSMIRAARAAFQWRLLLLWAAWLLIPTLVLVTPAWQALGTAFDHSVNAASLARELDLTAIVDLMYVNGRNGESFSNAGIIAIVLTLLISPLLSGMAATASRAESILGCRDLTAGGLREYPRMLRMMVTAIIPLGIAAALAGGISDAVGKMEGEAVLSTDAETIGRLGMLAIGLLLVLAHATVDAGRAALTIERRRTSAFKAWWDGCKMLVKRPFATLGAYLLISVVGLVLAALLTWLRIQMPFMGMASFIGGIALMLLVVMVIGWMRSARLFAMVQLAQANR